MHLRTHHQQPPNHTLIKHKNTKKPNIHKLFAEDLGLFNGDAPSSRPNKPDTSSFTSESDEQKFTPRPQNYTAPSRDIRLRHNIGSVYHHATRLSPYLSSSTNFSSSLSGSIEVIVSELEHQDDTPKHGYTTRLSPLGELSEHNSAGDSEASETEKVIRDIIKERERSILLLRTPEYHSEPELQRHLEKSFCDLAVGMQEILTEQKAQAYEQECQRSKLKKQLLKLLQSPDELSQLDSRTFSQDSITSEESLPELKEPIQIAESITKKPINSLCHADTARKAVLVHALNYLLESDRSLLQEVLEIMHKMYSEHFMIVLSSLYGKLVFSGLYRLNVSTQTLSRVWAPQLCPEVIDLSMISTCYRYEHILREFIDVGLKELSIGIEGVCQLPYSKPY